jgi:uncharacterized protein involved in exopolysaccharide biosynthesis
MQPTPTTPRHPEARPEPTYEAYAARDREDRARMEQTLWNAAGTIWRWKRFIAALTVLAGVAAVVISLLLPNVYTASTRLLLPSTGSSASAMLGDLGSAARSLLGVGTGGDYTRYLALMTSRTLQNRVIEEFDLVQRYEIEAETTEEALRSAREMLSEVAGFYVDEEFEYLVISVTDKDPVVAAEMANFYVDELTSMNRRIERESGGSFLNYIEDRYARAEADLDSLLDATMAFQQEYGLFDLPAQTQGFFSQVAQLRGEMLQADIEYRALRARLGDDTPAVLQLRAVVDAAERSYEQALSGQERVLPVAQSEIPGVAREYADLELARLIQQELLQVVVPVLEQARFDHRMERAAFEVVDVATPPVLKSGPRRAYICIVTTISVFFLAIAFALLYEAWNRFGPVWAERLNAAAERSRTA